MSFPLKVILLFFLYFFISIKSQDLCLDGFEVFSINTTTSLAQNISVANSIKFALKFKSNPTTGYDWYLSKIKGKKHSNILEFLNLDQNKGGQYISESNGLMGGGGYTYFLMESNETNSGEVDLTFDYKRIWLKNSSVNSKNVNIFVGQNKLR